MRQALRAFFSDAIIKQSAVIFSSSGLVNIFNLAFWLTMVRVLDATEYGVLNAVVALLMFFSVPLSIVQTVMTRSISRCRAQDKKEEAARLFWLFLRLVGIFLAVVSLSFLALASSLAHFLHIREAFIYAVGVCLAFSSLSGVTLGVLMGLQEFGAVAFNSIAAGVTKLASGVILAGLGMKAFGAFFGFVSSFAVMLWHSWLKLPPWLKKMRGREETAALDIREAFSFFLPVGLGTLCFFTLTNIDVILVKHFFSPDAAGIYCVAQMVGKIVLFISGAVGIVMFPKVVEAHSRGVDPRPLLKKCLLFVGGLSGGAAVVSCVFPGLILRLLTGHQNPEALPLVKFFAVGMAFFALSNIIMLYHISLHAMRFIYAMALIALIEGAAIWFFHQDLNRILAIFLSCGAALFWVGARLSFTQPQGQA